MATVKELMALGMTSQLATRVAKVLDVTLTDNSGGTADNTVEALPATQSTPSGMTAAERTAISNNFADLAAKINALSNGG